MCLSRPYIQCTDCQFPEGFVETCLSVLGLPDFPRPCWGPCATQPPAVVCRDWGLASSPASAPGHLPPTRRRPGKGPTWEQKKGGLGFVFMRLRPPPQRRLPAWCGVLISPVGVEDADLPAVATAALGSPVGSGHTGAFVFQKPPLLIAPVLFPPKSTRVPPMSLVFLFTLVYFCCSVFLAHVDEN